MHKQKSLILSFVSTVFVPVAGILTINQFGFLDRFLSALLIPPDSRVLLPSMIILSPLLLPLFNKFYASQQLPRTATIIQMLFYAAWIGLGFLVLSVGFVLPTRSTLSDLGIRIDIIVWTLLGFAATMLFAAVAHALIAARRKKNR